MTAELWVLLGAVVVALVGGTVLRRRAGKVRTVTAPADTASDPQAEALRAIGVPAGTPTIVRFTAPWCGRCPVVARRAAAVRDGLGDPDAIADIEVDLSADPDAAAALGVLSLPTTLLVDADTRVRNRIADVPTAADLHAAIDSLLSS